MEPNWYEPMSVPTGVDATLAQSQSAAANLPPGVPPLASRWQISDHAAPQTFGEFSEKTQQSYY